MNKILILAGALALGAVANAQAPRTFTYSAGAAVAPFESIDGANLPYVMNVVTNVNVKKYLFVSGSLNTNIEVNGAGAGTSAFDTDDDGTGEGSLINVTHCGDVTITPSLSIADMDLSADGVMTLAWLSNSTPTSAGFGTPAPFFADQYGTSGQFTYRLRRSVSVNASVKPGLYTDSASKITITQ